ncbi:hypothetical protein SAMN05421858_1413 [Haladaptatus litoreus]|uniref:DUF7322 domain-containing protein n=1 Tax=Haladaptatus litoreus TaxID=553468 RepID=A0A1N6Y5J2_9EURY|nr:hypothetical protein [Haladaptatus litoreus]SIR09915.1 hypothetical protein SAMN05421858_1413 [Haladaptatus litoreus]
MFDKFGHDDEGSDDPGYAEEIDMAPKVRDPSDRFDTNPPTAPEPIDGDADPEIQKEFWAQVILFNIALFTLSLGLMLVGFEQRWTFGGLLLAVGVITFVRGYSRYRSFQKD